MPSPKGPSDLKRKEDARLWKDVFSKPLIKAQNLLKTRVETYKHFLIKFNGLLPRIANLLAIAPYCESEHYIDPDDHEIYSDVLFEASQLEYAREEYWKLQSALIKLPMLIRDAEKALQEITFYIERHSKSPSTCAIQDLVRLEKLPDKFCGTGICTIYIQRYIDEILQIETLPNRTFPGSKWAYFAKRRWKKSCLRVVDKNAELIHAAKSLKEHMLDS